MRLDPLFTGRAVTYALAAGVVVVVSAAATRGGAEVRLRRTVTTAAFSAPSCPLDPGDQVKAIKAFAKMIPVFRHPRCSNCHGGVDPFADPKNGKHGGGQMQPGDFEKGACQECHDLLPGWRLAFPPMFWVKKSDEELCMQVREMNPDAAKYVGHIRDDNGGVAFTDAAFKGIRALNEGAQSNYESESGITITQQSPPGTLQLMTQQAQDYVDAMGGSLVGSSECGCKLQPVELRFHSTMTIVNHALAITSTITGDGRVVLKLGPEPSAPTWDVATGLRGDSAKIAWSGVSISQPTGCPGQVIVQSSPATNFKFWLGLSYSPDLKLSLEIIPGVDLHTVLNRCHLPNGTWINSPVNDPIPIFGGAWFAFHGQPAGAAVPAFDPTKLQAMDPKVLAAAAQAMKNNPDPAAAAAQMKQLINQMMPGASQMAAAARNNFRLGIPDTKGCKAGTGTAFLAECDFNQTVKTPSQTITEATTITISRPRP
jgi:hypothetical protein